MKTLFFAALLCIAAPPGLAQQEGIDDYEPEDAPADTTATDEDVVAPSGATPKKLMQAKAHFVLIENEEARRALLDMQENFSFEEVVNKYAPAQVRKDLTLARFAYRDKENRETVEFCTFEEMPAAGSMLFYAEEPEGQLPPASRWIFDYRPRARGVRETLRAFFITGAFSPLQLPPAYMQLFHNAQSTADSATKLLQRQVALLEAQVSEAKALGANSAALAQQAAKKIIAQKRRMLVWQTALQVVPINQILLTLLTR